MRVHPLAVAAISATLLLSACGSGDDSGTDTTTKTTTPAVKATPFAGKTPEQILAASAAATKKATSVHVKGQFTEAKETTKIDIVMSSTGLADGKIAVGGDPLSIRRIDKTFYIMADRKFWASQGLGAASSLLSGKWLKVAEGQDGSAEFEQFTDMKTFLSAILESDSTKNLTQVPGKTAKGVQTVGLLDSGKDGGTLYLAADEAKPYPVALLPLPADAAAGDQVTFTEWNAPVDITAPPADDTVDPSKLG